MQPSQRWHAAQQSMRIPEHILAAAPASPYGFAVATFDAAADRAVQRDTPSRRAALEALPDGGTVLDVGCGAGAASLPLAVRAAKLVGLDESEDMLGAFARRASEAGVEYQAILGRWPDAAGSAPAADVVVCHHVLYNVGDLEPFVRALTAHAREAVVCELTEVHPLAWLSPLWRELHGVEVGPGPAADDALAVIESTGVAVRLDERTDVYSLSGSSPGEQLAFVRRRLCLPASRDHDVARALRRTHVPDRRRIVSLSWHSP